MSARYDYPFPAAVADGRVNGGAYGKQETAAALDEIDRLRAWQTDTITWLREKRLLMVINGGEFCPADEIYTPEGLDVIRRQQTNEIVRLREAVDTMHWVMANSEGVVGLRTDGLSMPWARVRELYMPEVTL